MPASEDARAVAKRLHALVGGAEVTRKAAARVLARRDPTEATELLQHLLLLARDGVEAASCALTAMAAALNQEAAQIPYAHALKRLAELQDLPDAAALLSEGPAKRELNAGVAAKKDAMAFSESLGHLKTKARVTTDKDTLTKLLGMSHRDVIRNALLNPRLTEQQVVNVAARRPSRPEPLIEIFRSPKWGVRHMVRRALAFNPYLPLDVGSKVVPLLRENDLRELSNDPNVHDALREQADSLLMRAVRKGEPPPRGRMH